MGKLAKQKINFGFIMQLPIFLQAFCSLTHPWSYTVEKITYLQHALELVNTEVS